MTTTDDNSGFPVMTNDERRTTLIHSLRALKSWTTDYATAFVDDCLESRVAQAVPLSDGQIHKIWDGIKPQGDPSGIKFATAFARNIIDAAMLGGDKS